MKDSKNDSTPVLERFARDKRKRTVIATAERVERRPRLQRDAADSEQPSHSFRARSAITASANIDTAVTAMKSARSERMAIVRVVTAASVRSGALQPAVRNPPAVKNEPGNSMTARA